MPPDEAERLRVLHGLSILDTPAEEAFDRITRVLAHMLSVPIALVSLVDEHRQWFKSRVGVDACETSREVAFCTQMAQDVTARKQAERQLIAQAMRDPLTGLPNRRALTGHLAQHLASDRATRQALALFFLDLMASSRSMMHTAMRQAMSCYDRSPSASRTRCARAILRAVLQATNSLS